MLVLDASFSRIDRATFRQFYQQGFRGFIQCLWLGGYGTPPADNDAIREVAAPNLEAAAAEGFMIGGYINASPWYAAEVSLTEAKSNAAEMWPLLSFVPVAVEIEGLMPEHIWNHYYYIQAQVPKTAIYTSKGFWKSLGNPTSFSNEPLWDANYNGVAAVSPVDYGGWTQAVGHQYTGTTDMFGVQVDMSYFEDTFFNAGSLQEPNNGVETPTDPVVQRLETLEKALVKAGITEAASLDINLLAAIRGNQRAIQALIKASRLPPELLQEWLGSDLSRI